jgi:hypothetical protein
MGGAVFGGLLGFVLGGFSGLLWSAGRPSLILAIWLLVSGGLALLLGSLLTGGWQPGPLLIGLACGLLGGWWSGRDFVKVAQQQQQE